MSQANSGAPPNALGSRRLWPTPRPGRRKLDSPVQGNDERIAPEDRVFAVMTVPCPIQPPEPLNARSRSVHRGLRQIPERSDDMANELNDRKVAILAADGVERVE